MAIQTPGGGYINVSREVEKIYHQAEQSGMWIKYGDYWCTPFEFVQNYGTLKPDLTKVKILNPVLSMHKGREAIKQMILFGSDKRDIVAKLDQLNKFTDKVWGYIQQK